MSGFVSYRYLQIVWHGIVYNVVHAVSVLTICLSNDFATVEPCFDLILAHLFNVCRWIYWYNSNVVWYWHSTRKQLQNWHQVNVTVCLCSIDRTVLRYFAWFFIHFAAVVVPVCRFSLQQPSLFCVIRVQLKWMMSVVLVLSGTHGVGWSIALSSNNNKWLWSPYFSTSLVIQCEILWMSQSFTARSLVSQCKILWMSQSFTARFLVSQVWDLFCEWVSHVLLDLQLVSMRFCEWVSHSHAVVVVNLCNSFPFTANSCICLLKCRLSQVSGKFTCNCCTFVVSNCYISAHIVPHSSHKNRALWIQELISRWDTRTLRDVLPSLFTYLPLTYDRLVGLLPEYF